MRTRRTHPPDAPEAPSAVGAPRFGDLQTGRSAPQDGIPYFIARSREAIAYQAR